ncbi:putative F-box domain-containing protein [Helianthus anomalus]
MSDHIPFEIQEEIMNMLPVKSLLRFQSVCKAWSSLIESSDFIAHYRSQQQHLLDDDIFPQQKVSLTFPVSVKEMLYYYPMIISSCHGLVKTVTVAVPTSDIYPTTLGFGVCRETGDPKIVNIRYNDRWSQDNVTCIPSQVEVFTLSTGVWRSPYGSNLLKNQFIFIAMIR